MFKKSINAQEKKKERESVYGTLKTMLEPATTGLGNHAHKVPWLLLVRDFTSQNQHLKLGLETDKKPM